MLDLKFLNIDHFAWRVEVLRLASCQRVVLAFILLWHVCIKRLVGMLLRFASKEGLGLRVYGDIGSDLRLQ
jgi:hypothetical protein